MPRLFSEQYTIASFIYLTEEAERCICLCPHEPKSAVNVFVLAPSVHNLSPLTPCNLRGIDRQRGDWLSITTKRRHGHRDTHKVWRQKQTTLYTNITNPTENPSMWKLSIYPLPLSCAHKCLIWISLAPLPSNCLGPKLRPAQSLCANAQSSERTRGIKHTERDSARGTEEREGGQE